MQGLQVCSAQLRGTARELQEVCEGWDKAELVCFGAKHSIAWKFVMANSQHQNGVTEVLVKLCKGIMKALLTAIGTTILFLNKLFTLMKETKNLANKGPIGIKPNMQTDPQFLSPNSLLLGRCSDRMAHSKAREILTATLTLTELVFFWYRKSPISFGGLGQIFIFPHF